ncbi:MAG: glycosyltransferase family 4 protein [Deltaproteobacteria bacterium]|nr:glycosyltransferase family 4 protein [Deltaproteobacteria bacterium]
MKSKLKVLMIAPTPFFADRGCHVRIYEEIRALQEFGCEVVLCTYHIGRDMEGVKTERIINIPWYKKLEAGPSWQKPFLDILLLIKSFSIARRFKPDIIHAHLHEGAFIGRFISQWFGVPLLFDYQGSMTAEMADHEFLKKEGLFFRFLRRLEKWVDMGAKIIVPSSSGSAEQLASEFHIPQVKVKVVTDGVDTDIFRPGYPVDDLRKRLGIPERRKVVAYLGLLNEYQGVDLLLTSVGDVIKKLPDTHFLVMGYPDVEKYKEMADKLGVAANITFTGRIDYGEAPIYLCLGDIAVSAKLSKSEANGKVYNYMAAGLPTVCFDTPVNREILRDTGIYAEFGNRESLANRMVDLLSDEERLARLKKCVRERAVEELSWRKAGEKFIAIYNEILRS